MFDDVKPLAVPVKTACKLVGIGNTTMWALIKAGRVKTTSIGRRRLVLYASLESLLKHEATASSVGAIGVASNITEGGMPYARKK
jgi:excisionase family DNA binding protein